MFKMVMGELIFPHNKLEENMEYNEKIILTDILKTLKQILDVQKKILNNTKENNKDLSKQEKELLKG